ncbi:MAG: transporter substrate-binding domain-containing protein [Selenomonadaceae bacterium]|nr:transporter substrate-binding domain-containing protein [Selenomonadaceae bacterium]
MKFKSIAKIFLAAVIPLLVIGCGGEKAQEPAKKVGMLTMANVDEKKVDEAFSQKTTYYDNLSSMQMGLTSGQVDEIRTYQSVANYMASKNPTLNVKESRSVQILDSFCCAVREDNIELLNDMNAAIDAMENDGTLEKLVLKYITNLQADEEPAAVAMAEIPGAETIKVGVTGDLPPLDLIRADGTPAGFNTAVLAEIGRRIGRNVELVVVDSGARIAALTSGKIDVIFWAVVPSKESPLPQDADKPAGVSLTTAYYQDAAVSLSGAFAAMQ